MEAWTSHIIAFVIGALSGAAGQYLATKYTEKRQRKEAQQEISKSFEKLHRMMPNLFTEMIHDLSQPGNEIVREVVLLPNERVIFNSGDKQRFAYYADKHKNLQNMFDILVEHGFVQNTTPGDTSIYRLTEEFVNLLMKE